MKIHGHFKNARNEIIEVIIQGGSGADIDVDVSDDVYFAKDPVSIEYSSDDLFQVIISKSCTISLLSRIYLGDLLYAAQEHSIVVNVNLVDDKNNLKQILFAGFVEPNIYSQGYSNLFDLLDIICTDFLSTLLYNNIYDALGGNGDNMTYKQIFEAMKFDSTVLNLHNGTTSTVFWDKSRSVGEDENLLDHLTIPMNMFFSDVPEESTTNDEVLTECLQYIGAHIILVGANFYVYNNNLNNSGWVAVLGNASAVSGSVYDILKELYSSNNTNISLDDTYNLILILCDIRSEEELIDSPLQSETLSSPYKAKQLYMWETATGDKKNLLLAKWGYREWTHGNPYDLKNSAVTFGGDFDPSKQKQNAWFIRLMKSNSWNFYDPVNGNDVYSLVLHENGRAINQAYLLYYAKQHTCTPLMCSMGKTDNYVEIIMNGEFMPTPSLSNYLIISVNGNGDDNINTCFPNEKVLSPENNKSKIVFTGGSSGSLTPNDQNTTNYIIISGTILLQGVQKLSNAEYLLSGEPQIPWDAQKYGVPTKNGDEHYVLIYYDLKKEEAYYNPANGARYNSSNPMFVMPPSDNGVQLFKYKFNSSGSSTDNLDKVPVLECELKIGDKYFVEVYDELIGQDDYRWVKESELPKKMYDGIEYTLKTFSLGINPHIGDYIIGQEHDILNTVDISMNLEGMDGFAIPIRPNDRLSGAISFTILGPVNTMYNDVVRRHPTWFKHTKVEDNFIPLLAHVLNIYIKDFECVIATDNGKIELLTDKDLIYVSNENNNSVTKKDDITFMISTALTTEEAAKHKLKNAISLSSAMYSGDKGIVPILSFNSHDGEGKAEELFINDYYKKYSTPKLLLETSLIDYGGNKLKLNPFSRYNVMNKTFLLIGQSTDVKNCSSTVKLREL